MMPRRQWLRTVLAGVTALGSSLDSDAQAAATELKLPDGTPTQTFDFDDKGIEGWTTVAGLWAVEAMAGAPTPRFCFSEPRRTTST